MIMHFLLVTALFLEIFVGYNAQVSDLACEDGEEYDACRSPCEMTCDNIRQGTRRNCSLPCIPGCFCRRGLVRADDRSCVPPSECIRPVCQENEEYLDCGSPCARNCTNLNGPIFCTKPCYSGCFCKTDYVRDSRGRCIDYRNCRLDGNVQCPENEEYVKCINFCNTCYISEYCQTPYCKDGCDCKPGYFRNTYWQCITEEQCIAEEYALQQQCSLNEVYTSCVNPCNDCYSRGRCEDYLFNYCNPGCDCKPGFFRNDDGICIPEWNCLRQRQPICPPGEEYYDCIPTCRVTCDTYNIADMTCDTTCNRGCFCKSGLIRREDGLCVTPSECPARPLLCPEGEIFYKCLPTCRTTCGTFNSSRGLCSTECRQGCFCQPGYVRNDNGMCVPVSSCPSICGPNEEFRTCGSACPATCENFRERNICRQQWCLRGCFCKAGFVRSLRGNCIRPRNCQIIKPIACCSGVLGRNKGNETDDEDSTTATNITTNPVTTEMSSNGSTNASSIASTKPPATTKNIPDKTTTKLRNITTIPSSSGTTIPNLAAATTTPKSAASTTTPKSVTSTTTPKSTAERSSKLAANTTTPKSASITTTVKSTADMTIPKSSVSMTIPKSVAAATAKVPTTTSTIFDEEYELDDFTTTAKAPAANVTETQINTELTTRTDLANSTTNSSIAKP